MLLLALRESIGSPVIRNLGDQPPELRRVSQMLNFVVEIEAIVVHVNGCDATLGLLLDVRWSITECAISKGLHGILFTHRRHVQKGG